MRRVELTQCLAKKGLILGKWATNNPQIQTSSASCLSENSVNFDKQLGLIWNYESNMLKYSINILVR